MRYETPVVTDFGSIADHTFARGGGTGLNGGGRTPPKDIVQCARDKFGDYSCGHEVSGS